MKKMNLLLLLMINIVVVNGQFIYKLKADSVMLTNDSAKAELIIENPTRDIPGFLFNKGNGRTGFRLGLVKINDSTYVVGKDTLKMFNGAYGYAWLNGGNLFNDGDLMGTIDDNITRFISKNTERSRLLTNGNWLMNITADSGYKLYVNGKLRASDSSLMGASNVAAITSSTKALTVYGNLFTTTAAQQSVNGNFNIAGNATVRPGASSMTLTNSPIVSYDQRWNFGQNISQYFGISMRGSNLGGGTYSKTKYTVGRGADPTSSNESYAFFGVSDGLEFTQGAPYPTGTYFYMLQTALNNPITASNTGAEGVRAPLRLSSRQLRFNVGRFHPTSIEAIRIVENGNILMATTTDNGYKLDVNGTARISSLPFLATRDTVLTYDPTTKQLKVTAKPTGIRLNALTFHADPETSIMLTDQANSEQFLANSSRNQLYFEAAGYDSVRLVAEIITESTSSNTPRLYIQYSTDGTSWTTIGSGSGNDIIPLDDDSVEKTAWIALPAGARTDVIFRIVQNGGDGTADPALGITEIQFK